MDVATGVMLLVLGLLIWWLSVLKKPADATHASASASKSSSKSSFAFIPDKHKSLEDVTEALRNAGLESSNLILGIDFTKSNEHTGRRTFNGRCMHEISKDRLNPYQRVIEIIGKTLEPFDDDKLIPAYGFGDETTRDRQVFPFYSNRPCHGFAEVLQRYTELAPAVRLAGPTSFAPIIYEAINIVRESRAYHIIIIIADGQVTSEKETIDAIVEASKFPLSIVVIGVGDGPWETMEQFDDGLPTRKFDNFQFVDFSSTMKKHSDFPEAAFALAALQEIPDQYLAIRRLKLL